MRMFLGLANSQRALAVQVSLVLVGVALDGGLDEEVRVMPKAQLEESIMIWPSEIIRSKSARVALSGGHLADQLIQRRVPRRHGRQKPQDSCWKK